MARKEKIPNHVKKWQVRDEIRRKERGRPIRKFVLVVCEGVQTEPNYFKSFRDSFPKGVLDVVELEIIGEGMNTESLVQKAIDLKKKRENETARPVDILWVVFDRDSFSENVFNNAVTICLQQHPGIRAAWSNEAFELWYLLHLIYFDTAVRRSEYQRMLEAQLTKIMGKPFQYRKNSKDMFALLNKYGSQDFALNNSIRLEHMWDGRKDYAKHKPRTKVYELIQEFKDLIERYAPSPESENEDDSENLEAS